MKGWGNGGRVKGGKKEKGYGWEKRRRIMGGINGNEFTGLWNFHAQPDCNNNFIY